ncbi:MAG TPA: hypothetical protein ENH85_01220 [Candidatus Scalindua sp.]|nr:hypothetical protein [Candidatus Scalindua sp.]
MAKRKWVVKPLKKITPETPSDFKAEVNKKYYPSFSVKLKDIPEAKKWEIGKNYKLTIEVRQKGLRETEKVSEVDFEVRKIKPV